METKIYHVWKNVKDNIPGFKDSTRWLFITDEYQYVSQYWNKSFSEYHEGFGAGEGTIDTTYEVIICYNQNKECKGGCNEKR